MLSGFGLPPKYDAVQHRSFRAFAASLLENAAILEGRSYPFRCREILHDGCPTACLGDAAFGYVNVFTSHVNVGFFQGASLPDPARLLQGTGKFMRHVKVKPGTGKTAAALSGLIEAAYADMKARVEHG